MRTSFFGETYNAANVGAGGTAILANAIGNIVYNVAPQFQFQHVVAGIVVYLAFYALFARKAVSWLHSATLALLAVSMYVVGDDLLKVKTSPLDGFTLMALYLLTMYLFSDWLVKTTASVQSSS